ncbi:uncharacterized protein LOC131643267 [Vicia villosa]|uniref:uncharacterized protein LOC131643267 n=1 Tax=Vicia villosa TaxID=3911 RepID=UPI00273B3FC6|nr:uncharacterized protein LOC131643267 [Vicia villosa]
MLFINLRAATFNNRCRLFFSKQLPNSHESDHQCLLFHLIIHVIYFPWLLENTIMLTTSLLLRNHGHCCSSCSLMVCTGYEFQTKFSMQWNWFLWMKRYRIRLRLIDEADSATFVFFDHDCYLIEEMDTIGR